MILEFNQKVEESLLEERSNDFKKVGSLLNLYCKILDLWKYFHGLKRGFGSTPKGLRIGFESQPKIEEGLLEYRPIDFKKVGSLLIFLQESSFRPLEVLSWLKDKLWKYSRGVED